jgi:hypothetical protein
MQVIGTVYRSRYYFAWSMGHSSLALAGMDFLKWEPASNKDGGEVKGVWGRCRNAQPFKVEFCDSSRLLAGYWNTTTGNFLRRWVAGVVLAQCCGCLGVWWSVLKAPGVMLPLLHCLLLHRLPASLSQVP